MLTKRANILFDENTWIKLARLAREEEKSVGQLVRVAIEEYYELHDTDKQIQEVCGAIEKKRKQFKGSIDYKKLIEYGRKI